MDIGHFSCSVSLYPCDFMNHLKANYKYGTILTFISLWTHFHEGQHKYYEVPITFQMLPITFQMTVTYQCVRISWLETHCSK